MLTQTYNPDIAYEHIRRCNVATTFDPHALLRACLLAVGSIRISSKMFWLDYINRIWELYETGLSFKEIDEQIPFMRLKNKAAAINYFCENYYEMWEDMRALSPDDYHDYLCEIHGVGAAKAGFIIQMAYGELGCVDSVNTKRYGKTFSAVPHIYRRQVRDLSENTQEMWANWCKFIAARGNKQQDNLIWSPHGLSLAHTLFVEQGSFDPKMVAF